MNSFLAVLFATLFASPAPAASPARGEKTFDSASAAADALVQAASTDDFPALLSIFGSAGERIVFSGDKVRDKNDRAKFAELASNKRDIQVDKAKPNRATLIVGPDDWPFPVPLVRVNGKWHFASQEGLHEILIRRIGRDELDAIKVCRGYVEAQQEYASAARGETSLHQYAQKILSTPGKRDGLAWYDADGKPAGPIGENIAKALQEGYSKKTDPYHGYFFKILNAQGPAAPLGKRDYVIQGKMLGGFALVAWPAEYRATGVKSFIVNHNGVVYEKDLGPDTAKVASMMKLYNPDKTWKEVPDTED